MKNTLKKTLIGLSVAAVLLGATGCAKKDGEPTPETQNEDVNDVVDIDDGQDESQEVANPWTECGTLEDAAVIAGFDLSAPLTNVADYDSVSISAYLNEIIQINYEEGDSYLTLRKGIVEDNLSGVNEDFEIVDDLQVEDTAVSLEGDEESYHLATWSKDGYDYSLYSPDGFDENFVAELVLQID